MKQAKTSWATLAAVALAVTVTAQDKRPAAAPAMPPVPQPGPEHALLKGDEGVWDATIEIITPPGTQGPPPSKGTETNSLMGGMWLITDFTSDMMGTPFAGHGMLGWDSNKKKYVSVWTDNMSPGLMAGEFSYDAGKKTMTGYMEGPDMTGKLVKTTSVTEWKDPDTRVFTMYAPGPDGKETPGLRITYKRRK